MTGKPIALGEGERLHALRRKRFLKIVAAMTLVGGGAGFLTGRALNLTDPGQAVDPTFGLLGAIGVVLGVLVAIILSWRYFAAADEVEVADNLWCSTFGLYVYALLFPGWWGLHHFGFAPAVDPWWVFGLTMTSTLLVYAWRKLRLN